MLDLDLTPCPAVSSTSIHLMPPRHLRSEIMRLLVQKIWKWKEILFIYDNFLDTESMTDLKATLHSLSVSTYLVHVEQDMPSSKLARILKSSINTHYIFVAAKSGVFAEIINQAYPLGTLSKDYKWMIMSDGSCPQLLGRRELRRSNVLLLRATHLQKEAYRLCGRINSFTNSSQIYVRAPWAHLLSAGMEAFLRRSLKYSLQESVLNSRTICDVSLRSKRKKTISTVSNEVIVSNYGDVTFSPDTGSVSSFGYDLCSADDGSKNGYSDVGSWSPSYGLKVDGGSLFKNDFTDFGGRKLLIGSQVVSAVCLYEIVEPPDRLWGAPESNGSWNGIVGMVMRGEIEFGVGPLTITGVRQSVIDFTSPYTEDGIGILTKRPDLDSEAMFRLFKPLQPIVWACLGASIAGVSMLLYLANRYSP
ncbi:glutamate receptor ionotropic, delta-1, partial [Aplysia californica]|uniref:Glutamate receptor ionotropic, delta-1 n=1 Tax=Aplysia californica TaxID=6500 RepID=A0ABM0ZUI4_APLCA